MVDTIYHDEETLGSIHQPHDLEYANQAARLAGSGLLSRDIGHLAKQLDDSSYWVLTGVGPVTWAPFTPPATVVGDIGRVLAVLSDGAGGTIIDWSAAGTGDVTKVGTPVNDQVGVWTGDGTLEGSVNLTFDGANLDVSGNITVGGTVDGIDIATDVAANTLKVTNATHSGDATGATVLTIANDAVSYAKMQNVVADDRILGNVAGAGQPVAELTAAEVRTMINVADGATAVTVDDTAYNSTSWNANTDAATKNAIRDKIETMDTAIGLNTAKVTNANHTGDATGDAALTIANDAVTYAKMQNVVADDRILGNVAGAGQIVAELTAAEVRTMINVADGATAVTVDDTAYDATSWNANTDAATKNAIRDKFVSVDAAIAASGDVIGPGSSTDGVPAIFDGVTGKLLKDSTQDYARFNTSSGEPGAAAEGVAWWDTTDKTLSVRTDVSDVTLQVGQEIHDRIYNGTGAQIDNCVPVYLTGSITAGRRNVDLSDANAPATAPNARSVFGIATHDIANGGEGIVTSRGILRDCDTSAWSPGDELWLSETAGELTSTKPLLPSSQIRVGMVVTSHATTGVLAVNVQDLSWSGIVIGVDATGFSGLLSGTDTDAQTAFDTIDQVALVNNANDETTGTITMAGAIISANVATITHSGTTSLTISSTSGTVDIEGVTFTGSAISGATNTNWDAAYSHSQDNSQAHSDYLINNGDDTTSGTITMAGAIVGGNVSLTGGGSIVSTASGNIFATPDGTGYFEVGSGGSPGHTPLLYVNGVTELEGILYCDSTLQMGSNQSIKLGAGVTTLRVHTGQTTPCTVFGIDTTSKTFVFCDVDVHTTDWGRAAEANPKVYFQSASTSPEHNINISHDQSNAITGVGSGGHVTNHDEPTQLGDDAYLDLPANSCGIGMFFVGNGEEFAKVHWTVEGVVTLLDVSSANVVTADTDGYFCIFDNGTSVRVKNRLGSGKTVLVDYHYTTNPLTATFQTFYGLSGVDNLEPSLTINGTTVTPTFRYKGGDADGTDWNYWGYGADLDLEAGTVPSYNQGSPCLGTNDDSVLFNNGGYYQASENTTGDVTTEDIVLEAVFCSGVTSWDRIAYHRDGDNAGWSFETNGGVLYFLGENGGGTFVSASSAATTEGCWYHAIVFVDRSGSAQWYINGVASGSAANFSSISDTWTAAAPLTIGAKNTGTNPYSGNVAYLAMWKSASWLDTHLQATVAAERFAQLCGYYPQIAAGTALPTTKTRAFPAYIYKIESSKIKLYYAGSEWIRQCHRQDSLAEDVYGYLPETQAENLIVESEDFLTTWTKGNGGDALLNDQIACPDGRVKAGSLAADIDGSHYITISATLTAAAHVFSCFVKPGDRDWVFLQNTTVSSCTCYFDVANGTVGTAGAGATGYIEGPFFGDFYRCCIVFTGTAASHSFRIYMADADLDSDIAGDGSTPNLYFWGAQVEAGDYMTSPIITDGGTATRLKDQLQFVAGDNIGGEDVGQGTVALDVLFPAFTLTSAAYYFVISDGGASVDQMGMYSAASNALNTFTAASGGDPGGTAQTINVSDNTKHELKMFYQTDSEYSIADGVSATPDTDCDIPDDLDRIDIGQNRLSTLNPNCLIQNFRIYSIPTENG